MENKLAVAGGSNLPAFIENASQSFEGMKQVSQMYADSRTIPDHFYEKDPSNKTDYNKPMIPKIQAVLTRALELHIKFTTALQGIVPINGLMSLKVDLMKSMIFSSGTMANGGWKETERGSIESGDYTVIIQGKRTNGMEMTRSFSIEDAKRAGLWITPDMLRGQDGWKHKNSAWWKYGKRMIGLRAAGFLCRDLWGDVLDNSVSFEEAIDYPQDETTIIDTGGAEIKIPDKTFSQERSQALTSKATEKIDKRNHVEPPPENVRQQPMTYAESYPAGEQPPPEEPIKPAQPQRGQSKTMLNGTEGAIPVFTEDELMKMDVDQLQDMINADGIMQKIQEKWDQKNTNKKLRSIILAHYAGESIPMLAQYDPEYGTEGPPPPTEPIDADQATYEASVEAEVEQDRQVPNDLPWEKDGEDPQANEDMKPNTGFDASAPDPEPTVEGNKFGIEVPDLTDRKRAFDEVKALYEAIQNVADIDNKRFETLINTKFPQFQKYRTRDDFCYKAEISEVNQLLNSV